jgi:hypothetical protein
MTLQSEIKTTLLDVFKFKWNDSSLETLSALNTGWIKSLQTAVTVGLTQLQRKYTAVTELKRNEHWRLFLYYSIGFSGKTSIQMLMIALRSKLTEKKNQMSDDDDKYEPLYRTMAIEMIDQWNAYVSMIKRVHAVELSLNRRKVSMTSSEHLLETQLYGLSADEIYTWSLWRKTPEKEKLSLDLGAWNKPYGVAAPLYPFIPMDQIDQTLLDELKRKSEKLAHVKKMVYGISKEMTTEHLMTRIRFATLLAISDIRGAYQTLRLTHNTVDHLLAPPRVDYHSTTDPRFIPSRTCMVRVLETLGTAIDQLIRSLPESKTADEIKSKVLTELKSAASQASSDHMTFEQFNITPLTSRRITDSSSTVPSFPWLNEYKNSGDSLFLLDALMSRQIHVHRLETLTEKLKVDVSRIDRICGGSSVTARVRTLLLTELASVQTKSSSLLSFFATYLRGLFSRFRPHSYERLDEIKSAVVQSYAKSIQQDVDQWVTNTGLLGEIFTSISQSAQLQTALRTRLTTIRDDIHRSIGQRKLGSVNLWKTTLEWQQQTEHEASLIDVKTEFVPLSDEYQSTERDIVSTLRRYTTEGKGGVEYDVTQYTIQDFEQMFNDPLRSYRLKLTHSTRESDRSVYDSLPSPVTAFDTSFVEDQTEQLIRQCRILLSESVSYARVWIPKDESNYKTPSPTSPHSWIMTIDSVHGHHQPLLEWARYIEPIRDFWVSSIRRSEFFKDNEDSKKSSSQCKPAAFLEIVRCYFQYVQLQKEAEIARNDNKKRTNTRLRQWMKLYFALMTAKSLWMI